MFRIVRKSTIDSLTDANYNQFVKIVVLEKKLGEAIRENQRLFDHHNKRLTKPKPDKKGILRNNDGTFARKK